MLGLRYSTIFAIVCLLAVQAELVQIVTPEPVEYVTPLLSEEEATAKKRETVKDGMDSYLSAFKESQGSSSRYDPPHPDISYEPPDGNRAEDSYGPPHEEYGPPQKPPTYGPPQKNPEYGPPTGYQNVKPSYHTRQPLPSPPVIYGPPSPVSYLPSETPAYPSYGTPFMAPSPTDVITMLLSNLTPKGVDLKTIFKIVLKFVLFKLVVKLLAALCLLLAWPLFESKEKDAEPEHEEMRQLEALNDLTELVWNSIFPQRYKNGNVTQETDEGIIEKVAGEINEKMTVPSEDAAIGFLEFCVNAANAAVGWMMSVLRRRNNTMDPMEDFWWQLWEKLKQFKLANYVGKEV